MKSFSESVSRGFGDWVLLAFIFATPFVAINFYEKLVDDAFPPFIIVSFIVGLVYVFTSSWMLLLVGKSHYLTRTLAWGFLSGGAVIFAFTSAYGSDFLRTSAADAVLWVTASIGALVQSWRASRGLEGCPDG